MDRVAERRRAVALALHSREAEGLSIAQIAARLGRSPATVKAYFHDPSGEKARAVKARYQGSSQDKPKTGNSGRQGRERRLCRLELLVDNQEADRVGAVFGGGLGVEPGGLKAGVTEELGGEDEVGLGSGECWYRKPA